MQFITAQVCDLLKIHFMHGLQVTDNNYTIVDATIQEAIKCA